MGENATLEALATIGQDALGNLAFKDKKRGSALGQVERGATMPTQPTDGEPLDESAPDGATAVDGPDLAFRADGAWRRAAKKDDPRFSDDRNPLAHSHPDTAPTWVAFTLASAGVIGSLLGALIPGSDFVVLRGIVDLTTAWTNVSGTGEVATAPPGYRPANYQCVPVACIGNHPTGPDTTFVAHAAVTRFGFFDLEFERIPTSWANRYGPGGTFGFTDVEVHFAGGYRGGF